MKESKNILKVSAVVLGAIVLSVFAVFTTNETQADEISAQANQSTELLAFHAVDFDDKCGEGKCGEGKKSEKKENAKKSEKKEGKCGEGKCGEGKESEKKSEKKEEKKEHKCGEGKCGGQ